MAKGIVWSDQAKADIRAIDREPEKLELAKIFGATDVINAATSDPVKAVRELTGAAAWRPVGMSLEYGGAESNA